MSLEIVTLVFSLLAGIIGISVDKPRYSIKLIFLSLAITGTFAVGLKSYTDAKVGDFMERQRGWSYIIPAYVLSSALQA